MITNKKYILFDLDGTLTDPKVGICTCVQHALKAFGMEEPDLDKLEPFIGPPLKDSFMEFYGLSEEDALKAIEIYRERFSTVGKFENEVYPGISELLEEMKTYGYHLAVASSKPECFVKDILEHFGIAQHFEVVVGSELDGARTDKAEVIQETLNRLFHYGRIRKDQIVMIGDRKFDVQGAKDIAVTSVAVGYGYGSKEELKEAAPDYTANTVEELRELFIHEEAMKYKFEELSKEAVKKSQQDAEKRKNLEKTRAELKRKNPLAMVWKFLFPFLLFSFAGEMFRQLFGFVMLFIADKSEAFFNIMFVADASDAEKLAISGNGNAIIQMLSLICVVVVLYKIGNGKECLERVKKDSRTYSAGEWVVWMGISVALALGLNMWFVSAGLLEASAGYQEAATNLYAVGIPAGLLLYGIFTPLAEELLFRGIIFTEMKGFMKKFGSALLASALFGAFHGNAIQFIYGAILGMVLSYAFHYSGQFIVPVAIHSVVNILVFLASTFGWLNGSSVQLVVGIVLTVAAIAGFVVLDKKYKKQEAEHGTDH